MLDIVFVLPTLISGVASDTVFAAGTTWTTLTPLGETLDESNAGTRFHASTQNFPGVNIITVKETPEKRNFGEIFDKSPFVDTAEIDVFDKFKRKKIQTSNKERWNAMAGILGEAPYQL